MSDNNYVILHVSGPDEPGITHLLCSLVAASPAQIIDIGQSVLSSHLTLTALIDLKGDAALSQKVIFALQKKAMKVELFEYVSQEGSGKGLVVNSLASVAMTLVGNLASSTALARVSALLKKYNLNIREMKTLSEKKLRGIEFICASPENFSQARLEFRKEFFEISSDLKINASIQPDSVYRKNKKIACFDVDSTFVQGELIDELAALNNAGEMVAKITADAMNGKLDFEAALRSRVLALKGLSYEKAVKKTQEIQLTPGIKDLIVFLKKTGHKIGLVSGGFSFFVSRLKEEHALDFSFANNLVVRDGLFTGELEGAIVDSHRKAQVLKDMSQAYSCQLEQCIAIGDGANDVEMLKAAGLGIAYNAKEKLKEVACGQLQEKSIWELFYLMGFRDKELIASNI